MHEALTESRSLTYVKIKEKVCNTSPHEDDGNNGDKKSYLDEKMSFEDVRIFPESQNCIYQNILATAI